ncbi:hypothetical protein J6590_062718 [Homalodisca vitripennis]|nr:hypothetical protein J6590_062718 [Homalodisca vitripennis]
MLTLCSEQKESFDPATHLKTTAVVALQKGPTEEEEDALSKGRTSAELELRDTDKKQDSSALSPTTRTAAVRANRSNSLGDLQSWLLKRDTENHMKSSIGYDLTEPIHLIGSEVKKLHDIVSGSSKVKNECSSKLKCFVNRLVLENESVVRADEKRAKITAGVSVGTQTENDEKGTPDRSTRNSKAKTLLEELSKKLDDDQLSNLLMENWPGEPTVAQNEDGSEKLLDVLPEVRAIVKGKELRAGDIVQYTTKAICMGDGENQYTEQTTVILTIDPEEEGSNLVRSIRKGLLSAKKTMRMQKGLCMAQ